LGSTGLDNLYGDFCDGHQHRNRGDSGQYFGLEPGSMVGQNALFSVDSDLGDTGFSDRSDDPDCLFGLAATLSLVWSDDSF
jgi:hypothetical protein